MSFIHRSSCPDDATLVHALLEEAAGRPIAAGLHASTCARCASRAIGWRRTLQMARRDPLVAPPPAPADLAGSIMAAVRADAVARRERRSPFGRLAERIEALAVRPRWVPVAVAAALVVALGAGTFVGVQRLFTPGRPEVPGTTGAALWASWDDSTASGVAELAAGEMDSALAEDVLVAYDADEIDETELDAQIDALTPEQTEVLAAELTRRMEGSS